ncbi:MAG: hypothetical protein KF773_16860 [Deltaproteobacteria bacterium]|nr:hypothetical protein [Deltaproteobacteria bacterium]
MDRLTSTHMGGIGFSIPITRIPMLNPIAKERPISLLELHRHVWGAIADELGELDGDRHAETFSSYYFDTQSEGVGSMEGEDSGEGEWERSETELGFSFRDFAGCCSLSMYAMYHWAHTAYLDLACDGGLDAPDWTITPTTPGAYKRALVLSSDAFGYTRAGMCNVNVRASGQPLVDEDGHIGYGDSRNVLWSDLDDAERDALEWCALTGQCRCDFCTPRRARLGVEDTQDVVMARAAWNLLETGEQRSLALQARTAVGAWNWTDLGGPPELSVLHDWLAERGAILSRLALASMVSQHTRS